MLQAVPQYTGFNNVQMQSQLASKLTAKKLPGIYHK